MRVPVGLVLLLLLVAMPQPTVGQQTGVTKILEDGVGDVAFVARPADLSLPLANVGHLDLVSLEVTESGDNVVLLVGLANLQPLANADQTGFGVGFRHASTEFIAFGRAGIDTEGTFAEAQLNRRPAGGTEWDPVGALSNVTLSESPAIIEVQIPRKMLADQDANLPIPGRTLADFYALAKSWSVAFSATGSGPSTGEFVEAVDYMPDDGIGDLVYQIASGGVTGSTRFEVDRPMRSSNGEETTYLFEAVLTNTGAIERTYAIEVVGAPASWQVSLAKDAVTVSPGEHLLVPVALSTPFFHQHGTTQLFKVKATDVADAAETKFLDLGINYVSPPQPAGHHPTVRIHSLPSASTLPSEVNEGDQVALFMNTHEKDDADAGIASRGQILGGDPPSDILRWCARLQPSLVLGLDFDLTRSGTAYLVLRSPLMNGGTVTGTLTVALPDDGGQRSGLPCHGARPGIEIAKLLETPVSLESGQAAAIEVPIAGNPEGDLLDPLAGMDLYLDLQLKLDRAVTGEAFDTPLLEPGARLDLPLNEYHEPIHSVLDSGPRLVVEGSASVLRRPGAQALFELHLEGGSDEYDVEILGTRSTWTTILGPPEVGPESILRVAVAVPDGEPDRTLANLVIRGISRDHPDQYVHARIVVEVASTASDNDAARIAELQPDGKKAPLLGPGLIAVLLLVAVGLRRKRL